MCQEIWISYCDWNGLFFYQHTTFEIQPVLEGYDQIIPSLRSLCAAQQCFIYSFSSLFFTFAAYNMVKIQVRGIDTRCSSFRQNISHSPGHVAILCVQTSLICHEPI